jgi:hypothetical protein
LSPVSNLCHGVFCQRRPSRGVGPALLNKAGECQATIADDFLDRLIAIVSLEMSELIAGVILDLG